METVVLSVLIGHQKFLAALLNDKGQLIRGLALWEMYPSSNLLNQSQSCSEKRNSKKKKKATVHTPSLVEYCCTKMMIGEENCMKIIYYRFAAKSKRKRRSLYIILSDTEDKVLQYKYISTCAFFGGHTVTEAWKSIIAFKLEVLKINL